MRKDNGDSRTKKWLHALALTGATALPLTERGCTNQILPTKDLTIATRAEESTKERYDGLCKKIDGEIVEFAHELAELRNNVVKIRNVPKLLLGIDVTFIPASPKNDAVLYVNYKHSPNEKIFLPAGSR